MVSIGRRCLFSFLISSAFLLSIAHGDNSTTMQPATTQDLSTDNTNTLEATDPPAITEIITEIVTVIVNSTALVTSSLSTLPLAPSTTTVAFCTPNDPCQNGATCNDTTNMCDCVPEYRGDTCETGTFLKRSKKPARSVLEANLVNVAIGLGQDMVT
ncbi:multiple epidermal growth factor-like domains protein 9 [Lytechinus variegatus]|uniref:multiple epidermal growth factor-like domains protein 9 n=1 Tax=Lytechinus variegatus TaxID=7654 RepID=UPI001BB0E4E5|nr:multiple epidermal growth factor-like domains protein 9 [Lytechinus variegatus]